MTGAASGSTRAARRDDQASLDPAFFGAAASPRPPVHFAKLGHGQQGRSRQRLVGLYDLDFDPPEAMASRRHLASTRRYPSLKASSSGYGYPYDYSSGYGPGLAARRDRASDISRRRDRASADRLKRGGGRKLLRDSREDLLTLPYIVGL
jgi:hypothetical protein